MPWRSRHPRSKTKIASVVRDRNDVVVAYMFGSAVRGRRRRDPDVDVAVIFEKGLDRSDTFRIRCELAGTVAAAGGVQFADVLALE